MSVYIASISSDTIDILVCLYNFNMFSHYLFLFTMQTSFNLNSNNLIMYRSLELKEQYGRL